MNQDLTSKSLTFSSVNEAVKLLQLNDHQLNLKSDEFWPSLALQLTPNS